MQLKAAYKDNLDNETGLDQILGVITTADIWIFVIYDGKNFYETCKCAVGPPPECKYLDTVVERLVSLLDYAESHTNK